MEKTKYQSLVERLQQAQDRVKEVEESREALRQVFHAIDFDMGITRKGKFLCPPRFIPMHRRTGTCYTWSLR
jgi:hypothetical protein